jgi:hypothetical protein
LLAATVAFFTFVSAGAACLYAYCFIQSERAYLVIGGVAFLQGEPRPGEHGRDYSIFIRNIGHHVANVTSVEATPFFGIKRKLPDIPEYHEPIDYVVPPILPDSSTPIVAETVEGKLKEAGVTEDALLKGIGDGTIPLWVYGRIEYDTGYPSLHGGELRFCYRYLPPAERIGTLDTFRVCKEKAYTDIR